MAGPLRGGGGVKNKEKITFFYFFIILLPFKNKNYFTFDNLLGCYNMFQKIGYFSPKIGERKKLSKFGRFWIFDD